MKSKMLIVLVVVISAVLAGCATKPDPIDHLVAEYAAAHGWWRNGIFTAVDLPRTASARQVIRRRLEMHGHDAATCKILKIRHIYIPPTYPHDPGLFAALVKTKEGEKIVLFDWDGRGWWTRVCDVNPGT